MEYPYGRGINFEIGFSDIDELYNRLLDVDTGGGEFLLSLNHPLTNCSATENFDPNVELCKNTLVPLGIDFKKADGLDELPFDDESFDMIINRHGDFNAKDIYRLLKKVAFLSQSR